MYLGNCYRSLPIFMIHAIVVRLYIVNFYFKYFCNLCTYFQIKSKIREENGYESVADPVSPGLTPPPPHITRALTAVHNLRQVRKNPRRRLLNMLPCFVHRPPSFLYGSTPGLVELVPVTSGALIHTSGRTH